jgi:AcrR family transcriptional regulator
MSSATKAQRQEPVTARGRRSREELIVAARKVFERDGFAESRITDIAQLAGAAHGTFYSYFHSKEEIFLEVLQRLEGELRGNRTNAEERTENPLTRIRSANRDYLKAYLDNKGMMIAWEEQTTANRSVAELRRKATVRFTQRVMRAITRLQAAGQADRRIDPYYAAYALTGMVSRFAYTWVLEDDPPFEFEAAVEQLTLIWANAIGLR